MGIDEWLLDQAVSRPATAGAMLRFYSWRRPTLSIGFHQRRLPDHWPPILRQRELDLVRRPSGGRAVLHAGELTYALIWPQAPQRRAEAYQQACGWLRAAFAELGLPLNFGHQAASAERSSCFATSTAADLVHANGAKRIGSAQLWRGGCLLQHGAILLEPPHQLWQELFHDPPPVLPALPLEEEALIDHLRRSAERHWPCLAAGGLVEQALEAGEREAIAPRLGRYWPTLEAVDGSGETSPAATMPRAT
jgi:lipoate-protein ligase A